VSVTDEDIKKYYEENPKLFEQKDMVKASHILFATRDFSTNTELPEDKKAAKRKLADEVLKRAKAGEDFRTLVKQFSDDVASRENNGEYVFGRDQMVPEFESVAFAMSTNQISDIVTTRYGYHIIKVLEKLPARKIELAKVTPNVKEFLTQQALQKQIPAYIKRLKEEAGVQILEEKLKLDESKLNVPATVAPVPPLGGDVKR
jgi:parvulin-like peptidyl-prolyl isomerase